MKMFGYFDEEKNKTIESLEALSHVVAENVGGLKIDEEIAHYLADEFNKKHNVWILIIKDQPQRKFAELYQITCEKRRSKRNLISE